MISGERFNVALKDGCSAGPHAARNRLVLASASERRRLLLAQMNLGCEVVIHPADIDDGVLVSGQVVPTQWVTALAYLKARRVSDLFESANVPKSDLRTLVLGADTVCFAQKRILGQPQSAGDARAMLMMLRNATHSTITGVALIDPASRARHLFVDAARVTIASLSDDRIDEYIASGMWRGKAGAYNLSERIAAGWPIVCEGDPATVMGLPVRKLPGWLRTAGWGDEASGFVL